MKNKRKLPLRSTAVVLLSGGLDSATTLYLAKDRGFKCICLIFDYGQRHRREIESAKIIAQKAHCKFKIIKITLAHRGSALLNKKINIPKRKGLKVASKTDAIPITYVPGRNIIFLSFALSYAETIGAQKIFIGAHAQDYSGYPDCRPEFYEAFAKVIALGTKAGAQKKRIEVGIPLIDKTKAQIIRLGRRLGVPFELTWSCYQGGRFPCGRCDSCYYRAKGFKEIGLPDPISKVRRRG